MLGVFGEEQGALEGSEHSFYHPAIGTLSIISVLGLQTHFNSATLLGMEFVKDD